MQSALLVPFALLLTAACAQQAPDLREWRATDHDHTQDPGNNQVQGGDAGVNPELAKHGLNEVVLVAWEQNCVRCHGQFGRGDGPQGPMVHAADLTNERFLTTTTDDAIVKAIRDGKGLMPAFPLPESTLRSLVQLIRLLGQATAATAGSASGAPRAPSASAAPPASATPSGRAAHATAPHVSASAVAKPAPVPPAPPASAR